MWKWQSSFQCGWPKEWEKTWNLNRWVGDSKHCVDVVDKDGDSKEKPGEMVRTKSWFQVKQLKLSK